MIGERKGAAASTTSLELILVESNWCHPTPITRLNAALEGRYRIESELGEGGMATVCLADDLSVGEGASLALPGVLARSWSRAATHYHLNVPSRSV